MTARGDALTHAVAALARRDLSREVLIRRLEAAGFQSQDAAAAVERLAADGLLDDLRTARTRASRLAEQGYGDAVIEGRLREEGLGQEDVDVALGELVPEPERAFSLATGHRSDGPRRVGSLLSRRGFADDAVETALARLDCPTETELP